MVALVAEAEVFKFNSFRNKRYSNDAEEFDLNKFPTTEFLSVGSYIGSIYYTAFVILIFHLAEQLKVKF